MHNGNRCGSSMGFSISEDLDAGSNPGSAIYKLDDMDKLFNLPEPQGAHP